MKQMSVQQKQLHEKKQGPADVLDLCFPGLAVLCF